MGRRPFTTTRCGADREKANAHTRSLDSLRGRATRRPRRALQAANGPATTRTPLALDARVLGTTAVMATFVQLKPRARANSDAANAAATTATTMMRKTEAENRSWIHAGYLPRTDLTNGRRPNRTRRLRVRCGRGSARLQPGSTSRDHQACAMSSEVTFRLPRVSGAWRASRSGCSRSGCC